MLRLKKIIYIVLLCFSFSDELFFLDTFGFSLGGGIVADTELIYTDDCLASISEDCRDWITLGYSNLSILFMGKHRINFEYYRKSDEYNGFNLPYSSAYYAIGTNHYVKNKTILNLNFNIEFKYLFEKHDLYDSTILGFGISRENDSNDFESFTHLIFYFQKPSIGKAYSYIKLNFPIYMRILPLENVPSKQSLLLTPSLHLDNKDVYFSLSASISHNF